MKTSVRSVVETVQLVKIRQAGTEQPVHGLFSVLKLLIWSENAVYSWLATRSITAASCTALSSRMRAAFGAGMPGSEAARFIDAFPTAQSAQVTPSNAEIESDSCRQAPAFLNSHHSGSTGEAVARSTIGTIPLTRA